ncbi:hydrogenase maturation protein HypF [Bryocella elongata]|uniref:Carbamoyltransferase n=1 Tax=Bryocella elongata TaxID=863522 RepID=A0A1H6AUM5_9BACT|nr:carbamoyltransferase HypF [Bryocella elongata]SEG52353.1 hydrogenase maturation protein HypF [Bryocella elongata]
MQSKSSIGDQVGDQPGAASSRRRLLVRGVVQGVGFRPYVHQLAQRYRLAGFVQNTATGVVIEIEGEQPALAAFVAALPVEGPPLMRVDGMEQEDLPTLGGVEFVIRESDASGDAFALVPTDACVCAACLAEIHDQGNRRFGYAFTNCTHCGPRYSIIEDVPYDRPLTTMRGFAMCASCQSEYEDPSDRRFHAQPNACPVCGPRLELVHGGNPQQRCEGLSSPEILAEAARALLEGKIVAWKGLGGFQLACDAGNAAAVRLLRERKHRLEKPFAVMVANAAAARSLGECDEAEVTLLTSPQRPIVLLERREGAGHLADEVCFGIPVAGVMLPSTPMHDLLFAEVMRQRGADVPLVMTSGNLSEEPIAIDNDAALRSLAEIADVFVLHDRPIHTRVDDSVARIVEGSPMLLRRARGYAPEPLWLGLGDAEVLACGGEQKNTFCLTRKGWGLMSQHLGDLENLETMAFFEETLERMQRLFHVSPRAVVHDLHPGYMSTHFAKRWACERGMQAIGVQHHHAHIAACMAEHRLTGEVLGVAWDGTGYGEDGTIWGGEFLVSGLVGFQRAAHLRPVLLAGGDTAVREPWRIALAYLQDAFGEVPEDLAWRPGASSSAFETVKTMLQRRINTIPTSSAGRLFDAVASLTGLRHTVAFEGQAAMLLEGSSASAIHPAYSFALEECAGAATQVDLRPMIREIAGDRRLNVTPAIIAARFHATMVDVITEICLRLRSSTGLDRVCLGGGCFQNVTLLRGCRSALEQQGFHIYWPQRVPANDGGLALGQAAVALARIAAGL